MVRGQLEWPTWDVANADLSTAMALIENVRWHCVLFNPLCPFIHEQAVSFQILAPLLKLGCCLDTSAC